MKLLKGCELNQLSLLDDYKKKLLSTVERARSFKEGELKANELKFQTEEVD
jgi:hypothetical protein